MSVAPSLNIIIIIIIICDPTYGQIELFLEMCFPRTSACLHCGPYMTEINAENNGGQSEVSHPSSVFLNHLSFSSTICPFPRWFRPDADRSGDRRSRETMEY